MRTSLAMAGLTLAFSFFTIETDSSSALRACLAGPGGGGGENGLDEPCHGGSTGGIGMADPGPGGGGSGSGTADPGPGRSGTGSKHS